MKNLLDNWKVRNGLYFFLTILTFLSVSAVFSGLLESNGKIWFLLFSSVGVSLESLPILKGKKKVSIAELKGVTVFTLVIIILSTLVLAPDLILKAILLPITGSN